MSEAWGKGEVEGEVLADRLLLQLLLLLMGEGG
jgi:hypothetical protein